MVFQAHLVCFTYPELSLAVDESGAVDRKPERRVNAVPEGHFYHPIQRVFDWDVRNRGQIQVQGCQER